MKKAYLIRLSVAGIVGILAILAIYGFYPFKIMDLQFGALLARIFADFSIIALLLVIFVVILTVLFGRFYCSAICPFGILQEFFALIFKKKNSYKKNLPVKYFIASIAFGALIGGSAVVIRYLGPYSMFGSFVSLSITGIVFTSAVLILVYFKNRYFCTNICPVGAILGLLSKISLNKIYIEENDCVSCGLCAKSCPSGSINHKEKSVDNETCIKCLKCLTVCKKGALKYGIRKKEMKFNPKRRDLILAGSILILFSGAIKAGAEISKNFAKKIKSIILPPGAKNASLMANKCLNCNLCVKNCPNSILAKADDKFGAIHIDYSQGKGFCKFDCKKCSDVCPSGAIKKISLEEKQKTRIAMAIFDKEICTRCTICAKKCPTGAIFLDDKNEPFLDASKCIGCGQCAKSCEFDAIEMYAVNEQKTI